MKFGTQIHVNFGDPLTLYSAIIRSKFEFIQYFAFHDLQN